MNKSRQLGPNAKSLLIRFMSREAIPEGGDIADGVKFFLNNDHRKTVMDRAWENFNLAITAVRSAPDNPYGDDEEKISGAILEQIKEKEALRNHYD